MGEERKCFNIPIERKNEVRSNLFFPSPFRVEFFFFFSFFHQLCIRTFKIQARVGRERERADIWTVFFFHILNHHTSPHSHKTYMHGLTDASAYNTDFDGSKF